MSDTAPRAPMPQAGQIWREVDPRVERFVRIISVVSSRSIDIRTVIKDGGEWVNHPKGHAATAHPARFNGKRGGYEFVEVPDA